MVPSLLEKKPLVYWGHSLQNSGYCFFEKENALEGNLPTLLADSTEKINKKVRR